MNGNVMKQLIFMVRYKSSNKTCFDHMSFFVNSYEVVPRVAIKQKSVSGLDGLRTQRSQN